MQSITNPEAVQGGCAFESFGRVHRPFSRLLIEVKFAVENSYKAKVDRFEASDFATIF